MHGGGLLHGHQLLQLQLLELQLLHQQLAVVGHGHRSWHDGRPRAPHRLVHHGGWRRRRARFRGRAIGLPQDAARARRAAPPARVLGRHLLAQLFSVRKLLHSLYVSL